MIEFTDIQGRNVVARLSSVTHLHTDLLESWYVVIDGQSFDVPEDTWQSIAEKLRGEK